MATRKGMMVGKGKGKGYHNVIGKDPMVHSQSAKGIKQPQRVNECMMMDRFAEANKPKKLSERQIANRNYERYIIDNIDLDGYDLDPMPITPEEKLQALKDVFRNEYGHMIPRVGEQNAFKEWLSGIPSAIDIPFYNYDILAFAKKMGSLSQNPTEKEEDRVLENYWNFMANKIFQVFRKYKIR